MTPRAAAVMFAALAVVAGCASKRVTADEPPAPTSGSAPISLRVGLAESQPRIVIACGGPSELRASGGRGLPLRKGQKVTLTRSGAKVAWSSPVGDGVAITVTVTPSDAAQPPLTWRNQGWRGALSVMSTPGGGGLTIVNELDLETYLRGVVPAEIGRPGPQAIAAVEAQAVAARTYTIAYLGTRSSRGFDVYADVRDQVYGGAAGEDPVADVAIAGTRGLVLLADGKPVNAYYHANCGGRSEVPDAVWPRPAADYLAVSDDKVFAQGACFCEEGRHFRWREEWSAADLSGVLARTLPEYLDHMEQTPERARFAGRVFTPRPGGQARRPGAVRDVRVVSRTTSGRVEWLDVETDAGTYRLRGDRVRWVLAPASGTPAILRSAWFELEIERDGQERPVRVIAAGRGHGHGIGMCQHGAIARARAGQDVRAILGHYYPGAEVRQYAPESRP